MREKLNKNPIAQIGLIAVLAIVAGYLLLGSGGGSSSASTATTGSTEATVAVAGTSATGTATAATPGAAVEGAVAGAVEAAGAEAPGSTALPTSVPTRPLPAPLSAAYEGGKTVVLLVVKNGGIDDKLVVRAVKRLESGPDLAVFVIQAKEIARYAAITLGVNVQQVPALVVMRPRRLSGHTPEASVSYGFQTPQSVLNAVRDATYKGPEVTYHPN